jgi:uncharacterized membrane protein YgcG
MENLIMNAHTKRFGLRSFALILVIAALLFGGASITGAAAQSAIPGDALYPVKTTIEQTRLSLAQDAGDRAQMKMAFAQQRLDEIAALIKEGRYHEIREAVLAFESAIHGAILELETISQIDPTRGTRIALEITAALTRYAQTLSMMAANAPESVKAEVTRALDTTQIAGSLELPPALSGIDDDNANANGNDNLNENGDDDNANVNGNDNLNENGDDDNANVNGNDNLNENGDDDNANDNLNENGDDDNANDNLNENGDDDNANVNGNDNLNENGDDHNANGNGIDDNSNSGNGNGNDNQNGNSNDNSNAASGNDNGGAGGGGHNDNGNGSGGGDQGGNGNGSGGGGHGGNGND